MLRIIVICLVHFLLIVTNRAATERKEISGRWENETSACLKTDVTTMEENGGWDVKYDSFLLTQERCNIRRISSRRLTAEDFRALIHHPVIVEDISNVKCRSACKRNNLIQVLFRCVLSRGSYNRLTSIQQLYGDDDIRMNSANTYSHEIRTTKLKTYISDHMKSQRLDAAANE